jgi:hypothetical protein
VRSTNVTLFVAIAGAIGGAVEGAMVNILMTR